VSYKNSKLDPVTLSRPSVTFYGLASFSATNGTRLILSKKMTTNTQIKDRMMVYFQQNWKVINTKTGQTSESYLFWGGGILTTMKPCGVWSIDMRFKMRMALQYVKKIVTLFCYLRSS